MTEISCPQLGFGETKPIGWINSDIREKPDTDTGCDIFDGLPPDSDSLDYISSHYMLQELRIYHAMYAQRESHRRLESGDGLAPK
jgi:hypothetical protein